MRELTFNEVEVVSGGRSVWSSTSNSAVYGFGLGTATGASLGAAAGEAYGAISYGAAYGAARGGALGFAAGAGYGFGSYLYDNVFSQSQTFNDYSDQFFDFFLDW